MPTLLDVMKANSSDKEVGLIDETLRAHPEMTIGDNARTIKGTQYKTLLRKSLGNTSGSFRSANAGSTPPVHVYDLQMVETFIDEIRFQADRAVADRDEDGPAAFIARETSGSFEGETQGLCSQFYYGLAAGNAKGFPGLIDMYDATNMMVDAGGTTSATGSSVWLVKFGPQHVRWVMGAGGQMAWSPIRIESVFDPTDSATPPTKKFDAYVQTLLFYPGLQVGQKWSVCRIKKITADAGHTLTDAMIHKALAKFRVGIQPDVILMTRRSNEQLQESRTATNPTGTPAPFPTDVVGIGGANIPIKLTEALVDTESLTL